MTGFLILLVANNPPENERLEPKGHPLFQRKINQSSMTFGFKILGRIKSPQKNWQEQNPTRFFRQKFRRIIPVRITPIYWRHKFWPWMEGVPRYPIRIGDLPTITMVGKNHLHPSPVFPILQVGGFLTGLTGIIITRWWFQIFFIFTPIWGRVPFWLISLKWVETTNQIGWHPFLGKAPMAPPMNSFPPMAPPLISFVEKKGCVGSVSI